jgi:hypothetical protein
MSDSTSARPRLQGAATTTIVGGRPPGGHCGSGTIPIGIEVLIKKAAVDPHFKAALIEKRAAAASAIHLSLTTAETMLINSAPAEQLACIIANTTVASSERQVFLGADVAAMMALASATANSYKEPVAVLGVRPDPLEIAAPWGWVLIGFLVGLAAKFGIRRFRRRKAKSDPEKPAGGQ